MSTINQRVKEIHYNYISPGSENQYLQTVGTDAAWTNISAGPQGVRGSVGDDNTGNQGFQGRTGTSLTGIQGVMGPQGSAGFQGTDIGVQGFAGPTTTGGVQGSTGAVGPQGEYGRIIGPSAVIVQLIDNSIFEPVARIGAGTVYAFEAMIFWTASSSEDVVSVSTERFPYNFDVSGVLSYNGSQEIYTEFDDELFVGASADSGAYFPNAGSGTANVVYRGWTRILGHFTCNSTTDMGIDVTTDTGFASANPLAFFTVKKGTFLRVYKLA